MSELLDPDVRAYADEQEHDAGSDRGEGSAQADTCSHPPSMRRLVDGDQVCTVTGCGLVIEDDQRIVPTDRPGGVDPTQREGKSVGLRHVQYVEGAQSRPYTPEQVELEIVRILSQIERGAGWLTTKEEERGAAKLQYELAFARARWGSNARSADQRKDEALNECRELYTEWQLLELQCSTAREGMHNLRSMLSGFQSVARSISAALGSYR